MGRRTHTRESIIQTLQSLAQRLRKDTLALADLRGVLSASSVNGHFGSFGNALEAAGLQRKALGENFAGRGPKYSDTQPFEALLDLERTLGHEPRYNEFHANGTVSVGPFRNRFGTWDESLAFYRKWKSENGLAVHGATDFDPLMSPATDQVASTPSMPAVIATVANKPPMHFYGEPNDFRGLRHAPINEQGVVYLFGMVSRELGFYVEAVQQGFPDCDKFLYDSKRGLWAKAQIEIELRALNFRQRGHDPNQCDFVVCW